MKTDELLDLLSTGDVRIDRGSHSRTIGTAAMIGVAAAVAGVAAVLGFRPNFTDLRAIGLLVLKLSFTVTIVALGFLYLTKLARPGGERRTRPVLVVVPFVVVLGIGLVNLSLAPPSHWEAMIVGDQWLECLLSIPIIAVIPFAATIWAVRKGAPTDLRLAGAAAGLFAGGVSAMAYALHCMDDSLPFVTVWYGGTILLCTLAGAVLGPRLLRW
ncbi:MAG: hypothetical protein BGN84_17910 [Afipia sp. 62-7]|uniref:NrsF family protein n=1 Tax=Tardiphaga sp. TaxID=1926292 RepID=UPI000929A928|nr:DUF1109 domain-containing protein [Afipia sp.]OJU18473.1 MAG: hypothetical protein BGN84_17910 [Afipia sp. 62-7]OYU88980.1 MAG: hypothetical protein CFE29_15660 [Bradyrhizobiaceae bacterium PARB1]